MLDKLTLSLKVVCVDKDFLDCITTTLMRKNAIYPYLHGSVNFASIPANLKSHQISGIATGVLPTLLFVGLLRNSAKSGDIELNPYSFEHHNVGSVQFTVNGILMPAKRLVNFVHFFFLKKNTFTT